MSGLRSPQQRLHVEERHHLLIRTVDGVSKQLLHLRKATQDRRRTDSLHPSGPLRLYGLRKNLALDGRFDPR